MPHPEPRLSFAFEVRVSVDETELIGNGPSEQLCFTPITGGTIEGPRLRGTVLAGGGDWSTQRGDTTELDARYLLRAEDGALIDIVNRGYWRASAEVEARLAAGEPVDPEETYYVTHPVFRTGAPQHAWLIETVFVGMAREEDGQVCIRFFTVS